MKIAGADRYNDALLADLEANVQRQASMEATFDTNANYALLRHYLTAGAFHTANQTTSAAHTTARILVLALMRLPEPHFNLALAILPGPVQATPTIAGLAEAAHALETARFADFWTTIGAGADAATHPVAAAALSVPGFEDAVRRYALDVVALAYTKAPKEVVAEATHLNGADLEAYIAKHRPTWRSESDGFVIPQADDAAARNSADAGGIGVAQLAPFLTA
ncbi:eukaryotic translation initiation factor 3 subunit K [Pycnococcus provasolii]|uniref:Eukaryotic translation initiation factor 3 subunit K n=1 Tax=Pycnococcus provasolii TaxID=41880 RepID=A0A830HCA4_9CHLO|nr:eukaryotic translation initiation factor 3 subunit K [Pycnococcus provasolii]|mmetsp:Transcript_13793/g.34469  ORF Transcript_13793/g.34469 Transcript_13793/m.34469 type:complete len:222 (+) Transcript_13793:12-677(+)